jgi:RNA polymerase sigma-70 factor (ECF subfamily)
VLTIARNKIADYFRKRKTSHTDEVLATSVRDLGAGPSSLLFKHENDRLLLEALRSIHLDDQLILELHYWDDMSGPELCQVFECTEPAIRSRIRRAKERLTSELQSLSRDPRELADTVTDLHSWARKLRDSLEPYLLQLKRNRPARN